MGLSFLAYAIIIVVTSVLSYLLRPRIPKPQTQKWEQPRAEIGEPIPIGFGTFEVSPNLVAVGPLKEVVYEADNTEITEYWGKMVGTLCQGPVDAWVDIRYGDQSCRLANPKWAYKIGAQYLDYKGIMSKEMPLLRPIDSHHVEQFIGLPGLFEGGKKQGGIAGQIHLHWGTTDDVVCELVRELYGTEDATRIPGVCYASFGWASLGALGSELTLHKPWIMRFGSLDAADGCVLNGPANVCTWQSEGDQSACGWFAGYDPYDESCIWPVGTKAALDHNRWGIPLGSGGGHIYAAVKISGLPANGHATIEVDIQRTLHGSGGQLGSSTTFIGIGWNATGPTGGWNPGLHGQGLITPAAIASGVKQHHSIEAVANSSGEFWLLMGTMSAEYGEQDYRIVFSDLKIYPTVAESAEDWEGPYLDWGGSWPGEGGSWSTYDDNDLRAQNYFYFGANNPNPTGPTFILQRWPVGLVSNRVGDHAGIPAVIYEILTNTRWGMAEPATLIDQTSFEDAAEILEAEGIGVSFLMTDEREFEDWLAELLSVADMVLYTDPIDGLLKVKLIRADYNPGTVLTLTESDIGPVTVNRIEISELIGEIQVRYRRYWGGLEGDVVDEVLTSSLTLLGWPSATKKYAFLSIKSSNIDNLELKQGATVWVEGTDYRVNFWTGQITVIWTSGGNVTEGQPVTASYTSTPEFIGYKEDVETLQNLAVWMANGGHVRKEDVEYGMIGSQAAAKQILNRMLKSGSQLIRTVEFPCNRIMSRLYPGAVFKIPSLGRDLADTVWRVGKIDYGKVDDAEMYIEGIEDIFATDGLINIPTDPDGDGGPEPGSTPTRPPPLAAFYQILPSSIRIGMQAGNEIYNIQIQRADDVFGTGATDITPAEGVVGTTTYFDDSQTVGTTKWYRGRHIDPVGRIAIGDWTDWIEMTGVSGTPGTPVYVAPVVSAVQSDDGVTAVLTLTVTDPQNRIFKVEFQSKAGNGPLSPFIEDTTAPYVGEAALIPGEQTHIAYRVTYNTPGATASMSATYYWNAPWQSSSISGDSVFDQIVTTEGAAPIVILDEAGNVITTEN